jgi:hypothetical protein
MAEWLKATVSKTVVPVSGTVGSNPTLSASAAHDGLLPGRSLLFLRGLRYSWLARFDPSCCENPFDLDQMPVADRAPPPFVS